MSARAKNRPPMMWKLGVLLIAVAVLTGCGQAASVAPLRA